MAHPVCTTDWSQDSQSRRMVIWAGSVAKNYSQLSSLCGLALRESQLFRIFCFLSVLHVRAAMLTFVCLPIVVGLSWRSSQIQLLLSSYSTRGTEYFHHLFSPADWWMYLQLLEHRTRLTAPILCMCLFAEVPSMQDTMGYDVTRQSLLTRYNPNSPAPGLEEFFWILGLMMGYLE